jgi:surface antigen
MARADGHTVSSIPIVGSVFVDNGGRFGHVGVVIAVSGNTITVKDMNYSQRYEWTVRDVPISRYVYIYP